MSCQVKCEPVKDGWRFTAHWKWRDHLGQVTLEGFPSGKARDLLMIDADFFMKWWERHTVAPLGDRVIVSIPLPYTDVKLVVQLEPQGDAVAALEARVSELEERLERAETPYRVYKRITGVSDFEISDKQLMCYADRYRPDWLTYLSEQVNTSRAEAFMTWIGSRPDVFVEYAARVRDLSRWTPIKQEAIAGHYSRGCWKTVTSWYQPDGFAMGPFTLKECRCNGVCGCATVVWLRVTPLERLSPAECALIEGKK